MTSRPSYTHLSPGEMEVGLEVAEVGLGTVDYLKDTLKLDPLAADLFDLPAGQDIPRAELHARIHRDDWPEVETCVEALLDPTRPDVIDMTHRIVTPDGSIRWVNARKRVAFDDATRGAHPLTGVFAVIDITARRRAEIQSDMLIGELNHRTKNLITVVAGIARQLQRHSNPEDFPDKLNARLMALARNQDAIAEGDARAFDLRTVFLQQLRPFEGIAPARVTLDGPRVRLSPAAAQVMAMVAHELLTNAVKYGALSVPEGTVSVTWRRDGEHFRLDWRETGGPAAVAPEKPGFGTQVLQTLTRSSLEADVALDYGPRGFRATLDAPYAMMTSA